MRPGSSFVILLLFTSSLRAELPQVRPAEVGLDTQIPAQIDAAVSRAIESQRTPGAVVLILRQGKVAFRKAYGNRRLQPTSEAMTVDTVFDLASLTKPVATASAIWLLIEQGKLGLDDPVQKHLPTFGNKGKEAITVRHLLTHTSGLIADNALADYKEGRAKAFEKIHALPLTAPVGSRFIYSDVNFIVLGQLVEKLSGQSEAEFCRKQVFEPLGMKDTGFLPAKDLHARCTPTEKVEGKWLKGIVHDPRARRMDGVAGHAGLFGTADDLAVFAQMLLSGGEFNGKRIFKPATVKAMTTPLPVPGGLRTPGWDARTGFSSNRGEWFRGFGHTGFTGTSIWIDPDCQTAVIVLANRVHPTGKGNVTRLRAEIATIVANAIQRPPFPANRPVRVSTGIDVLQREQFKRLKGKKIGLVTNHTGVNREGVSTIDLLHKADGVQLVALFSPEHGIRGAVDAPVPDGKDAKTGLPVYSLYGKNRRPTAKQLEGIDTLVYDIQDIGCRFYTYITTLGFILEAATEHKLDVIVLDRPNPIGGDIVEGPTLSGAKESFVAYHSIPVRHGMTVGELARLFNAERKIGARLTVVPIEGWQRKDRYDSTGLTWINPSPNMRSLTAALLYPGVGLLETTNLSVGRGTDRPFEHFGAPWIDGPTLATALNKADLPGVRFMATRFIPTSSVFAKKECQGVQIYITDWKVFRSLPTGFTIAATLREIYPKDWQTKRYNVLLGNVEIHQAVEKGASPSNLLQKAEPGRKAFLKIREKYLLYPDGA